MKKTGSDTFLLYGNNTYTGGTEVSGGVLQFTDQTSIGTGTVTLNGGTLSLTATATYDNDVALSTDGGTIDVGSGLTATLDHTVSGTTTLTTTIRHPTKEARDGHLNSGIDKGVAPAYDRLAEVVIEVVDELAGHPFGQFGV